MSTSWRKSSLRADPCGSWSKSKATGSREWLHQAAYELKRYLDLSGLEGVPMFMAPYLSEQDKVGPHSAGDAL